MNNKLSGADIELVVSIARGYINKEHMVSHFTDELIEWNENRRVHRHAGILAKYAEVAARRYDPWVEFEYSTNGDWEPMTHEQGFYTSYDYRWVKTNV
jgi:hypothetical protein